MRTRFLGVPERLLRHLPIVDLRAPHEGVAIDVGDVLGPIGLVLASFVLQRAPPLPNHRSIEDRQRLGHGDRHVAPRVGRPANVISARVSDSLSERELAVEVLQDPRGLADPASPRLPDDEVCEGLPCHVVRGAAASRRPGWRR